VPDHRKHRGAHPEDRDLFAERSLPSLREAASDLSWLLNRGYASVSALKIVGDRHRLDARQRVAVARCACSDEARDRRAAHQVAPAAVAGKELWIDGYNVLTSIESALAGGVILHAGDGTYRDMASMHGTYRSVEETVPAIQILGELTAEWNVVKCHWLLDKPVSNSGRLKSLLQKIAGERGWNWQVELAANPDKLLCECSHVVATADSQVLDSAMCWLNLARLTIDVRIQNAWIVDLSR
jgi:hypothetical protein